PLGADGARVGLRRAHHVRRRDVEQGFDAGNLRVRGGSRWVVLRGAWASLPTCFWSPARWPAVRTNNRSEGARARARRAPPEEQAVPARLRAPRPASLPPDPPSPAPRQVPAEPPALRPRVVRRAWGARRAAARQEAWAGPRARAVRLRM